MRRIITFLLTFFFAAQAYANNDYPSRPITLIVPYSAGGTDAQYRKLAELAGKELGQSIIIENRPGGAGTAAVATMALNARPDGYTIAAATGPLLRQPHMMDVSFSPLEDFTWIAGLGAYTFVVTVRGDSPFETLPDLLEWARENPGKLTYATSGMASAQFIAMESLVRAAGIDATHIPYKGGNDIQTAVLGNHVVVGVNTLAGVMPATDTVVGIRALASFDPERTPDTADLPTVREYGYDIVQDAPYGLVGPRGMQPEVIATLENAFQKAVNHEENQALLTTLKQRGVFTPHQTYIKWAADTYETERKVIEMLELNELK